MTSERPTAPDLQTADPTWPVLSKARQAGMVWYNGLMSQAEPAAADSVRFAAALGIEL